MALQGFNADAGWRNFLEAQRYALYARNKGIADLAGGLGDVYKGYKENKLYKQAGEVSLNGTPEEQEEFKAQNLNNPNVLKAFDGVLEARRNRLKEEENIANIQEGIKLAQQSSLDAINGTQAQNTNIQQPNSSASVSNMSNPNQAQVNRLNQRDNLDRWRVKNAGNQEANKAVNEALKLIQKRATYNKKANIEEYIAQGFKIPEFKERSNYFNDGFRQFKGNPHYIEMLEEARKSFNYDPNKPTGKEGSTAYFNHQKWLEMNAKSKANPDKPYLKIAADGFGRSQGFLSDAQYGSGVQDDLKELHQETGKSRQKATKAKILAQRFNTPEVRENYQSGLHGQAKRWFDQTIGNGTYLNELETEAINIVNSDAIASLPVGTASDRDIAIVTAGFPDPKTSNPDQIISYLGSVERLAKIQEKYGRFAGKYVSDHGWNGISVAWYKHMEKEKNKELDKVMNTNF